MTDITDASPRLRDLNDICERLRKEIAWEQDVGELLEKAAAEIARLRLTDAEREAVAWASKTLCVGWHDLAAGDKQRTRDAAATLRGLLERTGGGE